MLHHRQNIELLEHKKTVFSQERVTVNSIYISQDTPGKRFHQTDTLLMNDSDRIHQQNLDCIFFSSATDNETVHQISLTSTQRYMNLLLTM